MSTPVLRTVQHTFGSEEVLFRFSSRSEDLSAFARGRRCIYLVDENVLRLHHGVFAGKETITVPSGEQHKTLTLAGKLTEKLIRLEADRNTLLIGTGGGVTTDITGFVASVYMRGIAFGYMPTTLLCMVDAAIGGKTGVDYKVYKNMIGTFRQPEFIDYNTSFLSTLSESVFTDGMAEAIKHACIRDKNMFAFLRKHTPSSLRANERILTKFISANAEIKAAVVTADVYEKNVRRHLNFGHTAGHAIETLSGISHGSAVSIGMNIAAELSRKMCGFPARSVTALRELCEQYNLPVSTHLKAADIWNVLKIDKKRAGNTMNFVLLNAIGSAVTVPIPLDELKASLESILG